MAKTKTTAKAKAPSHTDVALERRQALCDKFDAGLKGIAEEIAIECAAENVFVSHVDQAVLTLRRCGLNPTSRNRRFYKRHDFKVGCGSVLIGVAPSISSFSKDALLSNGPLMDQPLLCWIFMIGVPIVVAMAGIALAIYGWVQATYTHDGL